MLSYPIAQASVCFRWETGAARILTSDSALPCDPLCPELALSYVEGLWKNFRTFPERELAGVTRTRHL
jgi:hypothetical protein